MPLRRGPAFLSLLLLLSGLGLARADDLDLQRKAAVAAAEQALVKGPADIALAAVATLHLPAQVGFIPKKEAAEISRLYGNPPGDHFLGWVVPLDEGQGEWRGWLQYDDSGHVAEDDAQHWKADALLKGLQEGTAAGNAERTKMGQPAIEVTRWIEAPQYDAAMHRLVWSAEVVRKLRTPDVGASANYNTYVLGRGGYIALDFVADEAGIEAKKPIARALLARIDFNEGHRYGQFNASTDKVATFGLAALIAGVAAKKLGLLALLTGFLIKFAKIGVIAVGIYWKRIKALFGRLFGKTPAAQTPLTIGTVATRAPAAPEHSAVSPPSDPSGKPGA